MKMEEDNNTTKKQNKSSARISLFSSRW